MRLNGKVFEAVVSLLERRRPPDLYHAALEVHVPEGRCAVESTPVPNGDAQARGAVDYSTDTGHPDKLVVVNTDGSGLSAIPNVKRFEPAWRPQ